MILHQFSQGQRDPAPSFISVLFMKKIIIPVTIIIIYFINMNMARYVYWGICFAGNSIRNVI